MGTERRRELLRRSGEIEGWEQTVKVKNWCLEVWVMMAQKVMCHFQDLLDRFLMAITILFSISVLTRPIITQKAADIWFGL